MKMRVTPVLQQSLSTSMLQHGPQSLEALPLQEHLLRMIDDRLLAVVRKSTGQRSKIMMAVGGDVPKLQLS